MIQFCWVFQVDALGLQVVTLSATQSAEQFYPRYTVYINWKYTYQNLACPSSFIVLLFLFEPHMQLQFNPAKERSWSETFLHCTLVWTETLLFVYQGCCSYFSFLGFSSLTVFPWSKGFCVRGFFPLGIVNWPHTLKLFTVWYTIMFSLAHPCLF